MELDGNVIDTSCQHICIYCEKTVRCRKKPKFALARGLWLGNIPEELQQLSFAEKLLIGRVRHNRCVVRVAKGMHKMIANAVLFEHPMRKIYNVLPPPIEEMDELLAFIFTGPVSQLKMTFAEHHCLFAEIKCPEPLNGSNLTIRTTLIWIFLIRTLLPILKIHPLL